jgi:hypothetical protein
MAQFKLVDANLVFCFLKTLMLKDDIKKINNKKIPP